MPQLILGLGPDCLAAGKSLVVPMPGQEFVTRGSVPLIWGSDLQHGCESVSVSDITRHLCGFVGVPTSKILNVMLPHHNREVKTANNA